MKVCAVVRTLNSASTLEVCLQSLKTQLTSLSLVVVDSGSTDDTLVLAHRHDAQVVELSSANYTPGRALNLGFSLAEDADIVMILSSHCRLPDPGYVDRLLGHFQSKEVAAVCGALHGPAGTALRAPLAVSEWPSDSNIMWGLTNHAAGIRRDVWKQIPFDEEINSCEDKLWARRAHALDLSVVYDPALWVDTSHRHRQGLRRLMARAYREGVRCRQIAGPTDRAALSYVAAKVRQASQDRRRTAGLRLLKPGSLLEILATTIGLVLARPRSW